MHLAWRLEMPSAQFRDLVLPKFDLWPPALTLKFRCKCTFFFYYYYFFCKTAKIKCHYQWCAAPLCETAVDSQVATSWRAACCVTIPLLRGNDTCQSPTFQLKLKRQIVRTSWPCKTFLSWCYFERKHSHTCSVWVLWVLWTSAGRINPIRWHEFTECVACTRLAD